MKATPRERHHRREAKAARRRRRIANGRRGRGPASTALRQHRVDFRDKRRQEQEAAAQPHKGFLARGLQRVNIFKRRNHGRGR